MSSAPLAARSKREIARIRRHASERVAGRLPAGALISAAFVAIVAASMSVQACAEAMPDRAADWLKPSALKPGDTIALVAPAGVVREDALAEYAQGLKKAGYKVLISDDIQRKSGYLAGTDDRRAEELNAAIRNPQVRAVFPCQGGYGLTRILDRIDYDALRKDPKIVIGFSDLTALHLAIGRRARVISFHSPMPLAALWKNDAEHAFANASFQRAIFADQYAKNATGFTIALPKDAPRPVSLVKGQARGRLTGGNLTLICSTMGTPFAIDPDQAILIIEDVHEAPYRIDRFLSQLRLAGVLDKIAGVVAGDFSSADPKDVHEFDRILNEYFGHGKKPAVSHFPVGHISNNATLPLGALVELDADSGTIRVLENPVRLDEETTAK